jgi:site-specific DNA recombinase
MKAALYLRQSLDRSGEGAAVSRQETECRALAERHGWDVVKVYTDNDQSATKGKRPGWARLLADLKTGNYEVLLAWHTDRLYRRMRDLVELLEIVDRQQLRIATVNSGHLDVSTSAGRMLAQILGAVAEQEVAHKSERQRLANLQRAKAGVSRWSTRPYGYTMRDGKVVVVPEEAAELRAAAWWILKGLPSAQVVRDMNARQLKTAAGKPWTVRTLHRLLVNPRHAGRVAYRGQDHGAGDWPPILDADTADQLQAVLSDPRRRENAAATNAKHLLSGIAVCGRCGGLMYANNAPDIRGTKLYRCLKFHLARRVPDVDTVVEERVIARLSQPDAADLAQPHVDLDRLRAQVVELRGRRDSLARLLRLGLLDETAVIEQSTELTEQISGLERDILTAAGSAPLAELAAAEDVRAVWDRLDLPGRREAVQLLYTVTVLPAGRGTRFHPSQVRMRPVKHR